MITALRDTGSSAPPRFTGRSWSDRLLDATRRENRKRRERSR